MPKEIYLNKGQVAIIDDEYFDQISSFRWYFNNGYACRYVRHTTKVNSPSTIYLHRVVMDAPKGVQVDHINGDRLDNRRCNLRLCTAQQNVWNSKGNSKLFPYKGVVREKRNNKFRARFKVNGVYKSFGYFDTAIEAARSYNEAVVKYHGEFARLNDLSGLIKEEVA